MLDLTDEQIDEAAWRMAMQTMRLEVHQAVVEARVGAVDDEGDDELAMAWEASRDAVEGQVTS